MIFHGLKRFAGSGHGFDYVSRQVGIADGESHLLDVTPHQFVLLRTDVFTRDAFAAQGFFDDLQIGVPRHHHLAERTCGAEDRFQHRNRVVLEGAVTLAADKRAVEIPQQYPDIRIRLERTICHFPFIIFHFPLSVVVRLASARRNQMANDKCQMINGKCSSIPRIHSIMASTSPPLTVVPTSTFNVTTVPAFGAFISFCIFMASTTTMPAPASTDAPCATSTRTTFPGIGATIRAAPSASAFAAVAPRSRFGSVSVTAY